MDTTRWEVTSLSLILSIIALWGAQLSFASSVKYCATYNTGSTSANYSVYQSNGLCDAFCDGYAYAILQYSACWCSDFTPASSTTVELSECNSPCPGYPDDDCGTSPDYYIYIFKDTNPKGTQGPSSSSTTSSRTTQITLSQSSSSVPIVTSEITLPATTSQPEEASGKSNKGDLSPGAIVGATLGGVIFLLAIVGLAYFFWRKKQRMEAEGHSPRSSSAGMIGATADMSESGQQNSTRRGSKFIPIDDRMEFHRGLYIRTEGVNPRESMDSLRDDMDYSRRVLRATNPDPPAPE